jgi:PAS domain S-box-containing protein
MHRNTNVEVFREESISFGAYRLLTLNSYSILGILNPDSIIMYETDSLRNILGYESWERIGTNIIDYIYSEDIELFLFTFNKLLQESGGMRKIEYRTKHKNGYWIWVETNLQNCLNERSVNSIIAHTIDITDHKRMEEKLIESERKYRQIIDMQGVGIGMVDKYEKFLFSNPAADQIFDLSPNKLINHSLFEFLDDDEKELIKMETERRSKGMKSTYQLKITTAKNKIKYLCVTTTPNFDHHMNFKGAYGVFQDITERKNEQHELELYKNSLEDMVEQKTKELSEINLQLKKEIKEKNLKEIELRKFKTAFDTSISAFAISDLNGKIIYINKSCLKLLGYDSYKEVIDKYAYDFWENPEEIKNNIHKVLKGEQVISERVAIRKDGTSFLAITASNPVINNNGEIFATMSSIIDISERKEYEQELLKLNDELRESKEQLEVLLYQKNMLLEEISESEKIAHEALAVKDKFFSIIAHDLRSPFSGFLSLSELMNTEFDKFTEDQLKEMTTSIYKSADMMYKLVEDLLVWSKNQIGKIPFNPEILNIYEVAFNARLTLLQVAEKKNINIEILIDKEALVKCDRNMMNTIFRNLISNALKFSHKGGKVIIALEKVRLNKRNYHKISFIDYGIGISNENISKLFKEDERVSMTGTDKEAGSGLGLLICKEFVRMHGGNIYVVSKLGEGSVFYITIPADINDSN